MKDIVSYLTSTDVQKELSGIGMFPSAIAAEEAITYEDERVRLLYEALHSNRFKTASVYRSVEEIQKENQQKINYLKNG
jgi:hypothetical protein